MRKRKIKRKRDVTQRREGREENEKEGSGREEGEKEGKGRGREEEGGENNEE